MESRSAGFPDDVSGMTQYATVEESGRRMKTKYFSLLAGLLVVARVAAQVPEQTVVPPGPIDVMTGITASSHPLRNLQPQSRIYVGDAAIGQDTRIFDSGTTFGVHRTDPRLIAGINLTSSFAIETGYTNLFNRGRYFADYARPDDVGGALGVKGFNSYLAGRVTLPLGERLHLFGKAGLAYSQYAHHGPGGQTLRENDVGPYASVGLQYQIGKYTSLTGAYERYGDTAQKWGGKTNNNAVSVKFNMQF